MDIVLRATVIFLTLYVLVRLMGKRELGQMTPFELIVLVVIGDLIQQGVTQNDFSLTGAVIAVSTTSRESSSATASSWTRTCGAAG